MKDNLTKEERDNLDMVLIFVLMALSPFHALFVYLPEMIENNEEKQ